MHFILNAMRRRKMPRRRCRSIPVSRRGRSVACGPHRVLCGDATDAEAVSRLLGERKPFLMVTIRRTELNWIRSGAIEPG